MQPSIPIFNLDLVVEVMEYDFLRELKKAPPRPVLALRCHRKGKQDALVVPIHSHFPRLSASPGLTVIYPPSMFPKASSTLETVRVFLEWALDKL